MKLARGLLPTIAIGVVASTLTLIAGDSSAATPLALSSPSFGNGASIPSVYTCEGRGISPPLAWSDVPTGTKSFALIVDDPDSPDPKAPTRTWVQWIVYDLPASMRALEEDVQKLPPGAAQGKNDRHEAKYSGPCPAVGQHRYFFTLFALDAVLPSSLGAPTKEELEQAMKGHILARAELIGLYAMRVETRPLRRSRR